jgi:hypothetical protein
MVEIAILCVATVVFLLLAGLLSAVLELWIHRRD